MKAGDVVHYKAMGTGSLYDAQLVAPRFNGRYWDIEVMIPGQKEPMKLHCVRAERLSPKPVP